jgi:hypothetical protein
VKEKKQKKAYKRKFITRRKFLGIFDEKTGAQEADAALRHDADGITEHVSFLHTVRGQNNDAVFLQTVERSPDFPAAVCIDACGWLIEDDKFDVAEECKGE